VASLMPCEACPESGRAAAYLGRSLQEVFMVCRSCVGSGGTEATMFSKAVIIAYVQLPICLCEGIAMTVQKELATSWTLTRYSTWLSTTLPGRYCHIRAHNCCCCLFLWKVCTTTAAFDLYKLALKISISGCVVVGQIATGTIYRSLCLHTCWSWECVA
jgi:hypothetical protein